MIGCACKWMDENSDKQKESDYNIKSTILKCENLAVIDFYNKYLN